MKLTEHEHEESCPHHGAPTPDGQDDNDGAIWVNQFTEESARAFANQLQRRSSVDANAPITVYIDSGGGEAYSLLTMISAMDSVPNDVITVAMGKAMSAGAILLSHGDLRYASPHSSIMVHEVSGGLGGHLEDINNTHVHLSKLNEYVMQMLAKNCKIKGGYPALKKKLKKARDLYLSADEAVKFGLVDRVGVPFISKNVSVGYFLNDVIGTIRNVNAATLKEIQKLKGKTPKKRKNSGGNK